MKIKFIAPFLHGFGKALLCFSCFFILSPSIQAQNYDIYVSDAGNFTSGFKIIKYDSSGANPITFINSNIAWPQDMIFLEDSGFVLVSSLGNGKISRFDANTGSYLNDFATGIGGPTRMKIRNDTLYVLQWQGNNKVRRYLLDGTFLGDYTSIGVNRSIGMDWDQHGNFYVSSYNGDYVQKFGPNGVDSGRFVSSNLLGPTNIWFDQNGDLLVSDYNGTAVKRFDSTGNFVSNFMSGLSQSEGVAFLPNGNIIIGNGATNSVKEFDSNGIYIRDRIPNSLGGLQSPNAVVIRMRQTVNAKSLNKRIHGLKVTPTIGDQFKIEGYLNTNKAILVDMNGRTSIVKIQNGRIDLSNQVTGSYILKIKENHHYYSIRIVVSH